MEVLTCSSEFNSQHITMLLVWPCVELRSSVFRRCNYRVLGKFMKLYLARWHLSFKYHGLSMFLLDNPSEIN
jgi:hypothetical protein